MIFFLSVASSAEKKTTTFFSGFSCTFYIISVCVRNGTPKLLSEILLLLHISTDLICLAREAKTQWECEEADAATAAAVADSFSL